MTKASITTTESTTLFLDKPSIADRSSGKDRMDCMRQFRGAWDRFSADQARLTEFLEMKRKRPTAGVATHLPNTGWPGERSSGGCGLARPVVPGGVSLLAVLVSAHSSVVNAATIAIITATAKSMMRCGGYSSTPSVSPTDLGQSRLAGAVSDGPHQR